MTTFSQTDFTAKFRNHTDEQLEFASKDVRECLEIWRDEKAHDDITMQKWWAEFDAIVAEKMRRI